ncbi:MAG: hypothetical protein ACI8TP_000134 [Acidimicrobiales bacterium]|jgi:hypothetical protein
MKRFVEGFLVLAQPAWEPVDKSAEGIDGKASRRKVWFFGREVNGREFVQTHGVIGDEVRSISRQQLGSGVGHLFGHFARLVLLLRRQFRLRRAVGGRYRWLWIAIDWAFTVGGPQTAHRRSMPFCFPDRLSLSFV